jgi:hypothetical protein
VGGERLEEPCETASWTSPRARRGCGRVRGWQAAWTPCS